MSDAMKRMVMASMAVAALIVLLAIVDIILGFPFSGHTMLDVIFLVGAGIIFYMGFETYREMT